MIEVNEKYESWMVTVQKASTRVKEIIKICIINVFPKEWAKAEVIKLIESTIQELKENEAPEDLISKTIRAIKYRFVGWYNLAMNSIKRDSLKSRNGWLKQTYEGITGEPLKETKGFVLEAKGISKGSVSNPREFVTTQARSGGQAYIENYTKTVKETMEVIAKQRLTIRGKAGYSLSIRNLAEMSARHQAQVDELTKLKDNGVEFVVASTHVNASARCAIWQGKIFKMDVMPGTTFEQHVDLDYKPKPIGKIDGKDYYSLEDAMKHGFLGYNCRHRLVKYTKGMDFFRKYPPEKIERERKLEMTQRALERDIVHAKQDLALAVDKSEAKELKLLVENLTEKYYNYCRSNALTISRQRIRII